MMWGEFWYGPEACLIAWCADPWEPENVRASGDEDCMEAALVGTGAGIPSFAYHPEDFDPDI